MAFPGYTHLRLKNERIVSVASINVNTLVETWDVKEYY